MGFVTEIIHFEIYNTTMISETSAVAAKKTTRWSIDVLVGTAITNSTPILDWMLDRENRFQRPVTRIFNAYSNQDGFRVQSLSGI